MQRSFEYQKHQSSIKPTQATTINQTRTFKTVDGALASNCKPDRPGTVSLSEESVKGAVSSHNLEFRATEIKGNSLQIKQLQRYLLKWRKNIEQGRRWAKYLQKIILQAQNEPTPLKWLETCRIRLKNKLKQAHTEMPNQPHNSAQSRLTDMPNQAQDYAKSG